MKKVLTAIIAGVMLLVLTGCAEHYGEYLTAAKQSDADNKAMVGQYFASQAARDSVVLTKMSDPTSLVLYSMLQGQRDAALISAFKGSAIQAPTTSMDVWKVFWGNTMPTVARWGFGYLVASDLIDALGAGMTVGGDYTSMNSNFNAGGDMSGVSNPFTIDYSTSTGMDSLPFDPNM